MNPLYNWWRFAQEGDSWLVAYACLPPACITAIGPRLFCVGHALELYLKAACAKPTDVATAIRYGHNIERLWRECKARDSTFMARYELRESVMRADFVTSEGLRELPTCDQLHFIRNQQFYLVAKHLPDLKYLGLPWKSRLGPYAFAESGRDPYWVEFFRALRAYLRHPPPQVTDLIRESLPHVFPPARHYLERFLSP